MEKKIEQLLKEFDNIPEIYRDHDDDYDEKVTYYHENSMENGFGLEIHIHELVMDIYLAFGYVDISSDDIKTQSPFVIDDLEMNERELWREKLFASHLKKDASYFVSEWGDSGMCPGYTSYIGYLQIPCDVEVVVRFMDICKKL